MEELRLITLVISVVTNMLMIIWLLGKYRPKIINKNFFKILVACNIVSIISSCISNYIYNYLYHEMDLVLMLILFVNLSFIIVIGGFILYDKMIKKNKPQSREKIYVKANTFEIVTEVDYNLLFNVHEFHNVMKVNNKYILFNITPPDLDKDVMMNCLKLEDNTYLCLTYDYCSKLSIKNIISILLNYYCIILVTYGVVIAEKYYITNGQNENNPGVKFILIPFLYLGFKWCDNDIIKKSNDMYTKFIKVIMFFLHYLLLPFIFIIIFI